MRKIPVGELPVPDCVMGYTRSQVAEIMRDDLPAFQRWMNGQTMGLCEGRKYNPTTKLYDTECGGISHGPVTYQGDVRRFLEDKPIIDW